MKYIQVIAEESSTGVWDEMENAFIEMAHLGLPDDFVEEFNHWLDAYRMQERLPHALQANARIKELDDEGIQLCKKMKELQPGYKIVYCSDHDQTRTLIV